MVVDEKLYCSYPFRGKIVIQTAYIDDINGYIATLSNGKQIDISTGLEIGIDDDRIWGVITPEIEQEIKIREKAGKARSWIKRFISLDDKALLVYSIFKRHENESNYKTYLHNLDEKQKLALRTDTIRNIKANFDKPYWCSNDDALNGVFGCKKLLSSLKIKESHCLHCEHYKLSRKWDIYRRLRILAGLTIKEVGVFLKINDYANIENGFRNPTNQELLMLQSLYGVDNWSVEQVLDFMDTEKDTIRKKTDPFFKRWGDVVKINTFIKHENIKNQLRIF